jgi:hypothetical protein
MRFHGVGTINYIKAHKIRDNSLGNNSRKTTIGAREALRYKPACRGFESRMKWIFFNLPKPSSRTLTLPAAQPLTEMSTRYLSGGEKGGRRVRLTTLPPSVSRLSRENVGASTSHNPMGFLGLLQ